MAYLPSLFLQLGADKAAMATPGEALGTNDRYHHSTCYFGKPFDALTELGCRGEGLVTSATVATQLFAHMDVVNASFMQ